MDGSAGVLYLIFLSYQMIALQFYFYQSIDAYPLDFNRSSVLTWLSHLTGYRSSCGSNYKLCFGFFLAGVFLAFV